MLAIGLTTSLHAVRFGTAERPMSGALQGQPSTKGLAWDRGGGEASLGAACKCPVEQLLRDAVIADVEEACMRQRHDSAGFGLLGCTSQQSQHVSKAAGTPAV